MEFDEESPRKDAWLEPEVAEARPYLPVVAETYDTARPFAPGVPQWLEMFIGLAEGLSAALSDQQEIQAALDDVANGWAELIEQYPLEFEYNEGS